ncbi:MAG: hypothetical protein AAGC46_07870 [Solirubrobacteraceae bacterium]|nr:hypothetical protein [Patulibacter sp.]
MPSTFDLPSRLLLGAGPSQTTDRVLRALARRPSGTSTRPSVSSSTT